MNRHEESWETKKDTPPYYTRRGPLFLDLKNTFSPILPMNMASNYHYLHDAILSKRDANIAKLKKKRPAIVIASGPSLDVAIPYLAEARQKHKAHIFCGPTQMWALHHRGVTPDYVVQHDQNYRRCPECGSFINVLEDGTLECMTSGHVITGDEREELIRKFYISRWAPEMPGATMIAQPGVFTEFLRWPQFVEDGKLILVETNPVCNGMFSRDWTKADYIQSILNVAANNIMQFVSDYAQKKTQQPFREYLVEELGKAGAELFKGPGSYERQDIIIDLAACLFGPGNPYNKYPVREATMIAPSTAQQAAFIAWKMGYDPIYFVGYDMCFWKGLNRHNTVYHDGTVVEVPPYTPNENARIGSSGFYSDVVQFGEKELLVSYLSKTVNGAFLMPGLRCVEVVADDTPGNLELIPRVDLKKWVAGKRVKYDEVKLAQSIMNTMMQREEMI